MSTQTRSAQVRSHLKHPVIDSDGHFIEFMPAFFDYLAKEGGSDLPARFEQAWAGTYVSGEWYGVSPRERRERRVIRPAFWNVPTERTRDLATTMLPGLLAERMDDLGLDFAVLYPGAGLMAPHFSEDEVRRASCRALNAMYADMFDEFSDRMTPVAVIPMHTPEEAVLALRHATLELGLKAVVMSSYVMRPISAASDPREAIWIDSFGLDSEYDYDPVWKACEELGVVPTFHSGSMGWPGRRSISNYVFNHIGHFAAASEVLCRSLFLGGVTRRFPQLRFAFLEGGVGWARSLYASLIGHWEKRNRRALVQLDPASLDAKRFAELFERYAGRLARKRGTGVDVMPTATGTTEDPATLDEFARCEIECAEDICDLFVPSFYFGCEADDPVNASAFDTRTNPFGARLNAIFGSDIGHWDVQDMEEVTAEAYEPVENGWITADDFRDFVFANPARMWTAQNPDFFRGTRVEDEVAQLTS